MKLSIFTPVYNRESLIVRVYQSLLRQKFKDFEWIIINDGSNDRTEFIIQQFIKENVINIVYEYKENGGKHTAYNIAIKKARGELFMILDSDDIILENGLEEIINIWNNSYKNNRDILGISGIDLDSEMNIIGDRYPKDELICTHLEMREIYKVKGDKTEIFKTTLLKDNYFMIYKNEKFLTEAILFDKLYLKYKTVFINIPLIIRDYQKDGLSDNSLRLRVNNPIGAKYYYLQNMNLCITWLKKIRSSINYFRFYYHEKKKYSQVNKLEYNNVILRISGYLFYRRDNIKLKK